jgi:hypothetical protein
MDSTLLFIVILLVVVYLLHKFDAKEFFTVYHPTNYEMKPKLPCYDYDLQFNCANQIEDLDDNRANVCQTPTMDCGRGNPNYVMARALGRPRRCMRLL